MGPRTRRRRIEHARYVGLPPVPGVWPAVPPPAPALDRRVAIATVAVVGFLVVAIAGVMLLGGGGRPGPASAADLASPSPAATALGAVPTSSAAPLDSASASLPPQPSLAPAGLTGYRWPLTAGRITTIFGPVAGGLFVVDGEPFHDGLDIASYCGDHIVAAHDGTVLASGRRVIDFLGWVGDIAGYEARLDAKNLWGSLAIMVITDDGNGYRSVYVHLFKSLVTVGQHVKAGELIGWEGKTGDATGCHLHYSIYSPTEAELFQTDPASVGKLLLPAHEIARINPFSVLPPMSSTKLTWGWGAQPSASPPLLPAP